MTRYNLKRDRLRAETRRWLQAEADRIKEAPQAPEVWEVQDEPARDTEDPDTES